MRPTLREATAQSVLGRQQAPEPQRSSIGYVLGALGAMLFSLKAIFVKLAYLPSTGLQQNELDAITLVALRMMFAAPVFIVILIWTLKHRQGPLPWKYVIRAVFLGMLGYYVCAFLDFEGLKYITAQLERLLLFTYPLFVVIIGALFFGGRVTMKGLGAILMGYSGIALIFIRGEIATGINVPFGTALLLATALLFALFQLMAKPVIDQLGSRLFTCLAMISAGTAVMMHFITLNFIEGTLGSALNLPMPIFVIAACIAFLSTIIPAFLINMALEKIGAQAVAVLGMLGPIATIFAAIYILGEPFGWLDALGTILTLSGVGLYTWLDRRDRLRCENAE